MENIFIKDGVSKRAIIDFLQNRQNAPYCEIRAFSVIRKGEVLCRIAVPPYEIDDCRQLFSLSKSFCSTAVGFAVDEGLFDVTDRIVDIFPNDCPNVISEKLAKMTVHNVLTMSTGHKSCVMGAMKNSENPVKAFMEQELAYEPGEKFVYNTGATLLLSIIVQKYTGKTVYDYLYEKYFAFLEHYPEKWDILSSGFCEGGVGLYASIKDIENLGMLYLNGGKLCGRRFLSQKWVDLATSKQIDNTENGSADWCAGYGYQFWQNARGGFRADGAFGQLCFALPSTETIVCVQAETSDMQFEAEKVYKLADSIENSDCVSNGEFYDFIKSLYRPTPCLFGDFGGFGKKFEISDNAQDIKYISFKKLDNSVLINFVTSSNTQTVKACTGEYTYNEPYLKAFKPTITGLISTRNEICKFSAAVTECSENTLTLFLRYKNATQTEKADFIINGETLLVNYACTTGSLVQGANELCGKAI